MSLQGQGNACVHNPVFSNPIPDVFFLPLEILETCCGVWQGLFESTLMSSLENNALSIKERK